MEELQDINPYKEVEISVQQEENPAVAEEPILAKIISALLHPFLMGVYGVSLLFIYTDFNILFAGQFFRFLSPVFFLTCFIPMSSIYLLKRAGLIKDFSLSERQDRFTPYLVAFFSYCLLIYYFYTAKLFIWFLAILVAPVLLIAIGGIINSFWKISAHMMGIGGLIGATLSVCYNIKGANPYVLFIILFILAGCLGVARLILKRNTPAQVYIGFLVGAIVSYLCVWGGTYWGIYLIMRNL